MRALVALNGMRLLVLTTAVLFSIIRRTTSGCCNDSLYVCCELPNEMCFDQDGVRGVGE
jgi:hypothetical protein